MPSEARLDLLVRTTNRAGEQRRLVSPDPPNIVIPTAARSASDGKWRNLLSAFATTTPE